MKECITCGVLKDYNEFHANLKHSDGLQTKCKDCSKDMADAPENAGSFEVTPEMIEAALKWIRAYDPDRSDDRDVVRRIIAEALAILAQHPQTWPRCRVG